MGNNHASAGKSLQAMAPSCKVILSDGTVQQFHEPLTVAELMLEHPQQVVVEFKSVYNTSTRPAALPADRVLDTKTMYMMVPVRRGRPVLSLSTDEATQILVRTNAMLKTNYSSSFPFTGIIPFIAGRMCMCSPAMKARDKIAGGGSGGGGMIMDKKDIFIDRAEFSKVEFSMEQVDERAEFFMSREMCGKEWKPSLDTIKEKIREQKVTHWL